MTDSSYVHIIFIVDRSGSMQVIRDDTQGGIRSAVSEWVKGANGDKRTVSFHQFDTIHDTVYHFAPLEKAQDYTLVPRGGTALLDACGKAITGEGTALKHMPEDERPGQVVVIIATDGQENSSREYSRAEIREMIGHQQDRYGWKFTYLGANQDAFAEAASIGITRDSTLAYWSTPGSAAATYDVLTTSVSAGTVSTSSRVIYSNAQRDAVRDK